MYKICVYTPEKSVEKVKQALFGAGAGRIGNYDSCCWQSHGSGQFRPLGNSLPAIGQHGKVEYVEEIKIELVCEDTHIKKAIGAMRQAHPYEEPAFDVIKLEDFER